MRFAKYARRNAVAVMAVTLLTACQTAGPYKPD